MSELRSVGEQPDAPVRAAAELELNVGDGVEGLDGGRAGGRDRPMT